MGEGEEDSDFREWEEAINLEDAIDQSFDVSVCLSPRVWVLGFGIWNSQVKKNLDCSNCRVETPMPCRGCFLFYSSSIITLSLYHFF